MPRDVINSAPTVYELTQRTDFIKNQINNPRFYDHAICLHQNQPCVAWIERGYVSAVVLGSQNPNDVLGDSGPYLATWNGSTWNVLGSARSDFSAVRSEYLSETPSFSIGTEWFPSCVEVCSDGTNIYVACSLYRKDNLNFGSGFNSERYIIYRVWKYNGSFSDLGYIEPTARNAKASSFNPLNNPNRAYSLCASSANQGKVYAGWADGGWQGTAQNSPWYERTVIKGFDGSGLNDIVSSGTIADPQISDLVTPGGYTKQMFMVNDEPGEPLFFWIKPVPYYLLGGGSPGVKTYENDLRIYQSSSGEIKRISGVDMGYSSSGVPGVFSVSRRFIKNGVPLYYLSVVGSGTIRIKQLTTTGLILQDIDGISSRSVLSGSFNFEPRTILPEERNIWYEAKRTTNVSVPELWQLDRLCEKKWLEDDFTSPRPFYDTNSQRQLSSTLSDNNIWVAAHNQSIDGFAVHKYAICRNCIPCGGPPIIQASFRTKESNNSGGDIFYGSGRIVFSEEIKFKAYQ